MGGGGKGGASMAAAPVQEAPKPYQQEQAMEDAAQNAREAQLKKARAALGQEGSVQTSPFGSQEDAEKKKQQEQANALKPLGTQTAAQGKTLLGQ